MGNYRLGTPSTRVSPRGRSSSGRGVIIPARNIESAKSALLPSRWKSRFIKPRKAFRKRFSSLARRPGGLYDISMAVNCTVCRAPADRRPRHPSAVSGSKILQIEPRRYDLPVHRRINTANTVGTGRRMAGMNSRSRAGPRFINSITGNLCVPRLGGLSF